MSTYLGMNINSWKTKYLRLRSVCFFFVQKYFNICACMEPNYYTFFRIHAFNHQQQRSVCFRSRAELVNIKKWKFCSNKDNTFARNSTSSHIIRGEYIFECLAGLPQKVAALLSATQKLFDDEILSAQLNFMHTWKAVEKIWFSVSLKLN